MSSRAVAGNDTLSGAGGNDKLHGGAGNDTLGSKSLKYQTTELPMIEDVNEPAALLEEAGNDMLYGDAGNDKL